MEMHGYCSEFCESSQNLRGLSTYMAPFFLTAKYYDILMFVWGWGTLAKAKRGAKRGKEKSFKYKESPYRQVRLGV